MKIPVLFMGSKEDEMCRKDLEQEYKEMASVIQMRQFGYSSMEGIPQSFQMPNRPRKAFTILF